MANKNFTDFTLKTPTSGDFLVGYNADGSDEYRTTVGRLLSSYATNTSLNAASGVLLPTSIYQNASGSFATSTALNAASSVLLPTSIYQNASGSFSTNTSLNAASSVLLPTSVYRSTSGVYTTVQSNSAAWTYVKEMSSNWQSSYDYVSQNYENWDSTYTTVRDVSSVWRSSNWDGLALPLSGGVLTGNLTATNILATSIATSKPLSIFEGKIKTNVSVGNNATVSQERLGRMTMLWVSNGTNSILNLSETSNNRFLEGDVVGVWVRNSPALSIRYTPLGGSQVTITSQTGGGGYNSSGVALRFIGGTFVAQSFTEQNLTGVAAELKIESIQPNDPGEPFTTIGRGSFVHGLTLNAGHPKFTNGSDHFHLIHNGTGGNWQTLNGGYTHTTQRITQHTLAFRGTEFSTQIVAAYGASLTANQVTPPYGVTPETSNNYLALWTSANDSSLTVGKIAYFSVSPAGAENESLRSIGFTAASYPAKVISSNAIGSAESNADIPSGYVLPGTAARHFRVQPLNLSIDNWLGAALIASGTGTSLRTSTALAFTNSIINTSEVLRSPGDTLLSPDTQTINLSAKGGYNTVAMKNGCELVFDLTTTPLLSSKLPFLYEGLPVIVLLSNTTDLSAINYNGLTPNSAKCQYGLPLHTTVGDPERGEFNGSFQNYFQQTYDGYIYRSSPTQVIIRLGQQRGTEESRVQKFATPNIEYFLNKPGLFNGTYSLSLPPGGLSAVPLNGYRINGVNLGATSPIFAVNGNVNNTLFKNYGIWTNCNTGASYTLPPLMKGGLEFTNFAPVSSSDLQLIVYAGNKDPVHRPVAGMQLFSYERYPSIQPELKETGAIVSKFALGPSCEGFDRDTAVIGFGSTAYHYRSMAIGHRVETSSAEEIAIGVDDSVFRVTLSGISVSSPMLSSNGVDTFLKIKQDNGSLYGLKLQLL